MFALLLLAHRTLPHSLTYWLFGFQMCRKESGGLNNFFGLPEEFAEPPTSPPLYPPYVEQQLVFHVEH
jgi:hypothetical protein